MSAAAAVEAPITPTRPVAPPLTAYPLVARTDVKTLKEALSFVAAGLPSRPPMQVLLGILVAATPDGVQLSAFDYEISCTQVIDGVGTGRALIPGKLLQEVVKVLDPGPVELRVNASVTHLDVVQGDLELNIPLLPIEDYPALPTAGNKKPFATVTGAQLAELNRVTIAAGRDETIPVLTGVLIESEDGQLRAAATDRYRLAVSTLPVKTKLETAIKVPAKTLAFAIKHLGKAATIDLRTEVDEHGEGLLSLDSGTRRITTRLLSGEFPRYRSLIPTDTPVTITTEAPVLSKAIQQVAIMAARNAPVRVKITANLGLVIGAGNDDDAKGTKKVAAAVTGVDPIDTVLTAYNPGYLLDGIHAVGAKGEVRLAFNTPTKPVVLTEPSDSTFLYLLMPVRLGG